MKPQWVYLLRRAACGHCGQRLLPSWVYCPGRGIWCRACFVALTGQRPPALLDGTGWHFKKSPAMINQGSRS
ncbi:MAG TPA: hypothetical protein VFI32_12650 [Rhodanobacteraceae bacterium]|nr:hypothetical protein [Rhodanobacteraceae bacterium]